MRSPYRLTPPFSKRVFAFSAYSFGTSACIAKKSVGTDPGCDANFSAIDLNHAFDSIHRASYAPISLQGETGRLRAIEAAAVIRPSWRTKSENATFVWRTIPRYK